MHILRRRIEQLDAARAVPASEVDALRAELRIAADRLQSRDDALCSLRGQLESLGVEPMDEGLERF